MFSVCFIHSRPSKSTMLRLVHNVLFAGVSPDITVVVDWASKKKVKKSCSSVTFLFYFTFTGVSLSQCLKIIFSPTTQKLTFVQPNNFWSQSTSSVSLNNINQTNNNKQKERTKIAQLCTLHLTFCFPCEPFACTNAYDHRYLDQARDLRLMTPAYFSFELLLLLLLSLLLLLLLTPPSPASDYPHLCSPGSAFGSCQRPTRCPCCEWTRRRRRQPSRGP